MPYSDQEKSDFIEEIIARISIGTPLREICRQEGKPGYRVVYDWLEEDKTFAARFARARETGHDVIADECVDIADNPCGDVQRDKLRIETRLKLLAKWNPKKYGERMSHEHGGNDGQPIQFQVIDYANQNPQ